MPETQTVQQASRELAADHRRLHGLLDRLASAPDLPAMAEALAELHAALASHFNAEEKPGGLYDALGVCAPEFRARLAALVDDHFRFTGRARDLHERARAAGSGAAEALRKDVSDLVAALGEHERREHAIVEAAAHREA